MEIKLYTKKEAIEIIAKHPDKRLKTKQVVIAIEQDKDGIDREKRMFYIIEYVHKGCYRYSILFKEAN